MNAFADRADAGRQLGEDLLPRFAGVDVVVLGLPRGGVVVAYEAARVLRAPLDVVVVRKLGAPWQKELAMGAIAEGGVSVIDHDLVAALGVSDEELSRVVESEAVELDRRIARYRRQRSALDLEGRTAIIVDDGVATGATARAAALSVRARKPARVVLAVPVASAEATRELSHDVDEFIALTIPRGSFSVGAYYRQFPQTSDREVLGYLVRSQRLGDQRASAPPHAIEPRFHRYHRRSP